MPGQLCQKGLFSSKTRGRSHVRDPTKPGWPSHAWTNGNGISSARTLLPFVFSWLFDKPLRCAIQESPPLQEDSPFPEGRALLIACVALAPFLPRKHCWAVKLLTFVKSIGLGTGPSPCCAFSLFKCCSKLRTTYESMPRNVKQEWWNGNLLW